MSPLQHQGKMELFSTNYLILNLRPNCSAEGKENQRPQDVSKDQCCCMHQGGKTPQDRKKKLISS